MSILNGNISRSILLPEPSPFGEPFRELGTIRDLGQVMDTATLISPGIGEKLLVAAGRGLVGVYRVGIDGKYEQLSSLEIQADSRQLAVSNGFGYLTARADGLYVVDLTVPERPRLAAHVDTLELATGVAAAGQLLAVTNRHMGCELYDIADPYHPVRLGDFLCGEAQSVWLHQNLAIASDWMNKQVHIFDISNPHEPRRLSTFSVDGFSDGVSVVTVSRGKAARTVCLVASGHHSARLMNRVKYKNQTYVTPEMLADGYGCGHGIELFDITDPTQPEFLSRLKAPPLFGGLDTWRVFGSDGCCYFTDSMNGLFRIDITDLTQPRFTHNFRLPPKPVQQLSPPSIQLQCGIVTGVAVVNGCVCAACEDGVHILSSGSHAPALVKASACAAYDRIKCENSPAERHEYSYTEQRGSSNPTLKILYNTSSQLHSFVQSGDILLAACGENGIVRLDQNGGYIDSFATDGICHDVALIDDRGRGDRGRDGCLIATAEGDRGCALYRMTDRIVELSRIEFGIGLSVREVVAVGDKLVLQLGCGSLAAACLTVCGDKYRLEPLGARLGFGMLYHRHIARTTYVDSSGSFIIVLPLAGGPELLRLGDNDLERTGYRLGHETCPFEEGACGYGDKLICVFDRGYHCLDNPASLNSLPEPDVGVAIDSELTQSSMSGLPFVCGNRLTLLNRVTGLIEVFDISSPHSPCLIKQAETGLFPEFAASVKVDGGERIYIALGHAGLAELVL